MEEREREGDDARSVAEERKAGTAPKMLVVGEEDEDEDEEEEEPRNENPCSSPESPSQSSRELRAVARAFTAQYYRDMNSAPSRVIRRYYTVRGGAASPFACRIFF